MAPPVNRKAAERAKLAIFGESGITSLGGKGTILTAEAVEMHEFSSDSECSTLSSDSDTISSGPDANSVGSQDDGATQLSPDVDDTKKGYDEEAKLPDLSCSTNSQIQAFLGAPPAAAAAAAAAAATATATAGTASTSPTGITGTAEGTAAPQTYGDMKAVSKPKKKTLISL